MKSSVHPFIPRIFTVDELGDKLSPFVRSLLQSEPRFRLTDIGNDVYNDKMFFVVTKDVIYTPALLPLIEHELSHAVEMRDQSRWCMPDWGMSTQGFLNEKTLAASCFFAAMAREVRVRAIQLHMQPICRNDKHSTIYSILNNDYAWGGTCTTKYLPYGRFQNYQQVEAWVHDLREKNYRSWNLDRIRHEWGIRLTHMQNWMETKEAA